MKHLITLVLTGVLFVLPIMALISTIRRLIRRPSETLNWMTLIAFLIVAGIMMYYFITANQRTA